MTSFDYFNIVVLSVIALISIIPFYFVVIMSFADIGALGRAKVYLLPLSFDITPYRVLFLNNNVINGIFVSIIRVIAGTVFCMLMTTTAAYSLSKKTLPFRGAILNAIILTMFFGGGLIPYYLTVKNLGLVDRFLVLIIPSGIDTFFLIIIKNYFQTIPESLEESAKIDGATDIHIFLKIILPIAMPFMATFILFYAVGHWNDWWTAMLFISDVHLRPLQNVLRDALSNLNNIINDTARINAMQGKMANTQSARMALVVITTIPILAVYPFIQKYFVKGILIGSMKG